MSSPSFVEHYSCVIKFIHLKVSNVLLQSDSPTVQKSSGGSGSPGVRIFVPEDDPLTARSPTVVTARASWLIVRV